MGNEDLFHKNRERKTSDFGRNKAKRGNPSKQAQRHILIVCEDSKSSAFYFEAMANDLSLSAVKVRGKECGSAPSSVLTFAEAQYAQSIKDGDKYDAVYCAFDRDKHTCFDATISKIQALTLKKKPFFTITTTPCFEFWLLLHFTYTTKAYAATAQKSSCDCANTDLQIHWQSAFELEYGKNKRDIYPKLKGEKTSGAIKHAKLLMDENLQNGSINPQTNMHELVEYLQSLATNK